ncbi:hybrid sensor histidine kinase/response regulator [Desulfonema limicola]|uniref:hybrid sensor histidine kinase/response regulator n=1 Tax=Desulfonema limicola TaxID=45656 RepID=UPI001A9AA018|nr:hybrid sensor histidine kinase/response regulator [Desulfonema limicola]
MRKEKILVVDDEEDLLELLRYNLAAEGFNVTCSESGEDALDLVKDLLPDLILLDIMMPGLDGIETCNLLKKGSSTKDIPVIFITALSDTPDKVKGLKTGAVDYISKPFKKEEVLARIETHLNICSQKKKLKEVNAQKDDFFSIIAHDMRNIFNGLTGTSWLISEAVNNDNYQNMKTLAKRMNESSENAYSLLENLLKWSRLQKDCIKYEPQRISINELVSRVVNNFKANAHMKTITLSYSVPPDTWAVADINMTDIIMRNLVSNAVKFTEKGGRVSIYAKNTGDYIEISVCDTGTGICEQDFHKIMRIDVKYKKEGTEGEQGTGMGLLLCKDFIEKNQGTIKIKSKPGIGSEFTIRLPAQSQVNQEKQKLLLADQVFPLQA